MKAARFITAHFITAQMGKPLKIFADDPLTNLLGVFILFGILAVTMNFVAGTMEGKAEQKRRDALVEDLRKVIEAMRRTNASPQAVQSEEIRKLVTLTSGARWDDIRFYPDAPSQRPILQYRGSLVHPSTNGPQVVGSNIVWLYGENATAPK